VAECAIQLGVVPPSVGVGGHPPAHVDVVAEQLLGERCAPAQRVQVAAAEVLTLGVIRGVGERVALAELAFVPDEVDVVEVLGDRLGRPGPTARSTDQLETGVDASDVVMQVIPGERVGADVVITEFPGPGPPGGPIEALTSPP
jgi:hypothetical protein